MGSNMRPRYIQFRDIRDRDISGLHCTTIKKVPSAKYLGIILDEKLDWKEHIEAVTASLAKITNSLKIVKNFIPHKNKHLLYYARGGGVGGVGGGCGVLGPKTDGGVPLATENWTQKDWGKNGIWGQKDRILWELVVLIPQKIVLVLVDEKKYPKKIEFNRQNVKKGGQNGGTSISPNIEGVPSPGYYAYIYSKIKYGIEVYGTANATQIKKVQVKQNRALKVLFNKDFLTPTDSLHKELEVLKVNRAGASTEHKSTSTGKSVLE